MSKNKTLTMFKSLFGINVMNTKGLYHIIDNEHQEIYINSYSRQIDKRGKYHTVVVMDDIVVSEVVTKAKIKYVILNKYNLKSIYKTAGIIKYLDNNLLYSIYKNQVEIIAHNGKVLCKLYNVQDIIPLPYNRYLLKSKLAFADRIVYYDRYNVHLIDLTEDRQYIINAVGKNNNRLVVTFMHGGRYTYDFDTEECYNTFTEQLESNTFLWKIL